MPKRQIKEPIRLREKSLSSGDISLYLDIYHNGSRNYEFLKLYLIGKPKTQGEKQRNKETLELAQAIKAKRIVALQHNSHGFTPKSSKKVKFLPYIKNMGNKFKENGGDWETWNSLVRHFERYCKNHNMTFADVTPAFVEGFRNYLLNEPICRGRAQLSRNTAKSYYDRFKMSLKQAVRDNIIPKSPSDEVKPIKKQETRREFLTFDELNKLAATDCAMPILKRAFLFSALSGLRWSDIKKLTWKELRTDDNGNWFIQFRQEKTEGEELHPISKQARDLLGDQGEPDDKVFKYLAYNAWSNTRIKEWVMRAGIAKDITFHCARHTYATLQLTLGTDIYTVSKLLGHKDLKTTQVYAKIIDEKKQEAAHRIPELKLCGE